MDKEKLKKSTTTNGITPGYEDVTGAPSPINPETGQHTSYWVLSEEERAKGFIRPVRSAYYHVGMRPKYPVRDLTDEEKERYKKYNYMKYEKYPGDDSIVGSFWTKKKLNSGCGTLTTMSTSITETYARDPKYYGSTFCVKCEDHFPAGEFVWADSFENGVLDDVVGS